MRNIQLPVKTTAGSGTATVTLPPGAHLLNLQAHGASGGGSVQIYGGATVPLPATLTAYFVYSPQDLYMTAQTGANTIVFTNVDVYFVEFATPLGS